jgi:YggT family protein
MRELFFALHVYILSPILWLFVLAILAYVVLGWLFTTGVVRSNEPTARQIYGFLNSIVEPLARPIRRFVPPI